MLNTLHYATHPLPCTLATQYAASDSLLPKMQSTLTFGHLTDVVRIYTAFTNIPAIACWGRPEMGFKHCSLWMNFIWAHALTCLTRLPSPPADWWLHTSWWMDDPLHVGEWFNMWQSWWFPGQYYDSHITTSQQKQPLNRQAMYPGRKTIHYNQVVHPRYRG